MEQNAKNFLDIELGGNPYKLQYSLGLPNYLDEYFEIDLINFDGDKVAEQTSRGSKLIKFIHGVIWSGIANHADQTDQPHPLTREQVLKLLNGMDATKANSFAIEILKWVFDCIKVPVDIEADSNTSSEEDGDKGDRFHV